MNVTNFFSLLVFLHSGFCLQGCTAIEPTVWESFSIDGVREDTGYDAGVIDYLFQKHYHDIFQTPSPRTPDLPYHATYEQLDFYLSFTYIHLYPRKWYTGHFGWIC